MAESLCLAEQKNNPVLPGISEFDVVIAGLTGGLVYQKVSTQRQLAAVTENIQQPPSVDSTAQITGLSGSLVWRGDHGQVVSQLSVGIELAGGTIEGMAPDSWFELAFHDGSTVMIAGVSILTFSNVGQKERHLNEGVLSASVLPQPKGKVIYCHQREQGKLTEAGNSSHDMQ